MTFSSALYPGLVTHRRLRHAAHQLRYRVSAFLLDLEELPALDRALSIFSYNRAGLISFYDKDHGPRDGSPLRPWAERCMREAGVRPDGGAIRLLCYPRFFGYVFNPISVYFCHRRTGELAAILYEVRNTRGERHTYAIAVTAGAHHPIRQTCSKAMYVSPFLAMTGTYHFSIRPPQDRVLIFIRYDNDEGPLLATAFAGKRLTLNSSTLLRVLAYHPLMTVKVIAGIHWEAFLLWMKGFRVFPFKPSARPIMTSTGRPDPE